MKTHPAAGHSGRRDHVDASSRPQVPESHGLVLRAADEHRAAPVVQTEHVAAVAAERLERRARRAVRHVDLAVAGAAAYQQARFVRCVLQEAEVAHRTVVHGQFDLLAWKFRGADFREWCEIQ